MSDAVITFDNVSKYYPLYHHITGGFKHFLFNFPQWVRTLKHSRFNALCNISFDVSRGKPLVLSAETVRERAQRSALLPVS